jgi:hypothetical protein
MHPVGERSSREKRAEEVVNVCKKSAEKVESVRCEKSAARGERSS